MNASNLLVPSPFGRAFLRAPSWLQEPLPHHGFGPHQSDGHVLVHTCLRPAVPEDELVLEDHPDFVDVGTMVTWTTTFGYILNTALIRMGGGDPAAGDHMEVHLQMLELLAKVRGGPDPTAYSERELRWEIVDRERWLNSFIPAPITDLKLVKWRHWKPPRIKELGPINQKVLEGHLRRKWAERLLAHLIPHAGEIPHLAPLRMRNWNFMTFSEIPVSGHSGNDALFLNRCSNGTCRSLGKRATSGSSSTASGPRRSLPTSFSCVGTHYVGLLRSLGFWLCRKNIGSSRRSRPWRQDSLLLWYSQPGKPKYHLRKSSRPWKKGLLECPFFPELIARRKRGHMPQESWTPSSWGLSATRWAARPDSMTFSTRHLPLWSIQLPPLSSQHGRPRQSVPHGSGNIRFPWFVQSIPSQAMHGGNLYLHGGPASLSIQALRKVTISSPPSARMAWASSPGLARLIEPFVGCIGEKGSSPRALSGSHMAQLPRLHPRLCLPTRDLAGSEKILG